MREYAKSALISVKWRVPSKPALERSGEIQRQAPNSGRLNQPPCRSGQNRFRPRHHVSGCQADENGQAFDVYIDHREVRPTYDKDCYHKHANAKELGYDEDLCNLCQKSRPNGPDASNTVRLTVSQKRSGHPRGEGLRGFTIIGRYHGLQSGPLDQQRLHRWWFGIDNTFEGMRQLSKLGQDSSRLRMNCED